LVFTWSPSGIERTITPFAVLPRSTLPVAIEPLSDWALPEAENIKKQTARNKKRWKLLRDI
jgi:hypothetical protein